MGLRQKGEARRARGPREQHEQSPVMGGSPVTWLGNSVKGCMAGMKLDLSA